MSESSPDQKPPTHQSRRLTRRELGRIAVLGSLGAILSKSIPLPTTPQKNAISGKNSADKETPFSPDEPVERVKISDKLTITVLRAEHYIPFSSEYIQKLVDSSDGAIIEYNPRELKDLKDNPVIQTLMGNQYKHIMDFFTPIQDAYFKAGKPIYNLDPVRDLNFPTVFRANVGVGIGATGVAAGVIGLNAGRKIYEKVSEILDKKITRRNFLVKTGVAAATVGALTSGYEALQQAPPLLENITGQPNSFRIESNFRRIVLTEGLKQLGQKFDQESGKEVNLFFLYPKLHEISIMQRLSNPSFNRGKFAALHAVFRPFEGLNKSFFSIRKYQPTESGEVILTETPMN